MRYLLSGWVHQCPDSCCTARFSLAWVVSCWGSEWKPYWGPSGSFEVEYAATALWLDGWRVCAPPWDVGRAVGSVKVEHARKNWWGQWVENWKGTQHPSQGKGLCSNPSSFVCFDIYHVIYQVREIILFGWSENVSTQGPEHCHIEFCKALAHCTNNKDIFLTILRWHARAAHLQYLRNLEVDLADAEAEDDGPASASVVARLEAEKNDAISCELGIRYPTLQSIMGARNHLSIQVQHDIYYVIYHDI